MSQIPPILLEKLAQLRRRERLLRLVWGAARLATIILVALLLACFIDWLIDLWDDTPVGVRWFMLGAQIALAVVAVLGCVVIPQWNRFRDEKLALFVESKQPALQHRLISALELNQPGARTEGMSRELLAAMTHEAETQVRPMSFAPLADHGRLKRGALVLIPVVVVALALLLFDTATALALLQRQLLQNVDIPRAVSVEGNPVAIWPSGEENIVKVKAYGPGVTEGRSGSLRIREQGSNGRSFGVPLVLEKATGGDAAIYVAKVPAGSVNFSYTAKVGDGRMHASSHIHYAPRPSIIDQKAYVILPEYVGLRPDGTPYEQQHLRGDVIGMAGLKVRIVVKTQKPIQRAVLQTFGSPYPDLSGTKGLTRAPESKGRTLSDAEIEASSYLTRSQDLKGQMLASLSAVMLRPGPSGPLAGISAASRSLIDVPLRKFEKKPLSTLNDQVEWVFDLRPTETSYRVVVFDVHGFASKTETVRTIKIDPEPPPTVVLHPERWDPDPIFKSRGKTPSLLDFEGMPLLIDDNAKPGPLRISYDAHGPYGISKAQLKIGVIRGGGSSEADAKPKVELWVTLELAEPFADVDTSDRVFDKSRGAFVDSPDKESVPFYTVPTLRPQDVWPRQVAGGRYDYLTAGFIPKGETTPFAFKPGDQVVVYVEVFNRNPDPKKALVGKSRLREKELVQLDRFIEWLTATSREADRIELLLRMQQQVYDRPWLSIFGPK